MWRRSTGSGDPEQVADGGREAQRVIHGTGVLQRGPPQRRRQRRRAEPIPLLGGNPFPQEGGGGAVAVGVEQPGQQLFGGLPGI